MNRVTRILVAFDIYDDLRSGPVDLLVDPATQKALPEVARDFGVSTQTALLLSIESLLKRNAANPYDPAIHGDISKEAQDAAADLLKKIIKGN